MKKFDIYFHSSVGYQAVKQGFSWPAFFFTWIWAFYHRLVGSGLAILSVTFFFLPFAYIYNNEGNTGAALILLLINLGFVILFGEQGNNWISQNLLHKGFNFVKKISASSTQNAVDSVAKQKSSLKV